MKYNEDKILKEIGDYIKGTYGQHYAQVSKGTQVQDLLKAVHYIVLLMNSEDQKK